MERIVQRFLRDVEVAEQTNKRGEHATRFSAVNGFRNCARGLRRCFAHGMAFGVDFIGHPADDSGCRTFIGCDRFNDETTDSTASMTRYDDVVIATYTAARCFMAERWSTIAPAPAAEVGSGKYSGKLRPRRL